jgi:hypothetical protein
MKKSQKGINLGFGQACVFLIKERTDCRDKTPI